MFDQNQSKGGAIKFTLAICLEIMSDMPDNSIDLITTSPPYADARSHTYGGIQPDEYVRWFVRESQTDVSYP